MLALRWLQSATSYSETRLDSRIAYTMGKSWDSNYTNNLCSATSEGRHSAVKAYFCSCETCPNKSKVIVANRAVIVLQILHEYVLTTSCIFKDYTLTAGFLCSLTNSIGSKAS
jgi:hypothetical protein